MNIYFVTLFCNNIFFCLFHIVPSIFHIHLSGQSFNKVEIICGHTKLGMYTYILYLYCVLLKRKKKHARQCRYSKNTLFILLLRSGTGAFGNYTEKYDPRLLW